MTADAQAVATRGFELLSQFLVVHDPAPAVARRDDAGRARPGSPKMSGTERLPARSWQTVSARPSLAYRRACVAKPRAIRSLLGSSPNQPGGSFK